MDRNVGQLLGVKFVLWHCLILLNFNISAQSLSSIELELSKEMDKRGQYDKKKHLRIEAKKEIAESNTITEEDRFQYYLNIASEFDKFSFDSTLLYIEKSFEIANRLKNKTLLDRSRLYLSRTLGNVGRSKEAEDILMQVSTKNLTEALYVDYCSIAKKLYEDLSFYAIADENSKKYLNLYNYYKDTLLSIVPKDSEIYYSIIEKDLLDQRKLEECLNINSKRLEKTAIGTTQYSLIAFQRSLIYELKKDVQSQKKYLLLSAISDMKASIKDNASMAILAVIIFNEDEIEKAYRYIAYAFEDAVQYNSRLRFFEISKTMALITDAYQKISIKQKDSLKMNLVIISTLGIILLITAVYIFMQFRKLSTARTQLNVTVQKLNDANKKLINFNQELEKLNLDLSEANHIKEQYIANFLNIHSDYIEKIDKHQKLVKKMLNGRQFDKLMTLVSSQDYIDLEIQEFYNTFDNAFISIYPDFIKQINKLLKTEQQILVKDDEILNTELRIFALIRLGIKDSSHIARLLRYSVNTIYNYRVKIKNRAIVPRDDFEELIRNIGAFNEKR